MLVPAMTGICEALGVGEGAGGGWGGVGGRSVPVTENVLCTFSCYRHGLRTGRPGEEVRELLREYAEAADSGSKTDQDDFALLQVRMPRVCREEISWRGKGVGIET